MKLADDDKVEFSVQEYDQDGSGTLTPSNKVTVSARSALEAAQLVLGEDLVLHGPAHLARVKVWRIGDDFQPIATVLYQVQAKQEA